MNKDKKLIFIAGPCVIETKEVTFEIAEKLKKISSNYDIDFFFKASFDKANRTSLNSFRGPGRDEGLKILKKIKKDLGLKIVSDVHSVEDVLAVKDVLDVIQIPAFLSRQTDIVVEAAKTGKTVNVKKAQFMSADDMRFVIEKIAASDNKNIFLTERGSCFGYNNLIVDFRSFLIMKDLGYPVIFDVTHSLQRPSAKAGISGGDSQFVDSLALAGIACGVDGLFMEVHPNPKKALSDSATSYNLDNVEQLLKKVLQIRKVVNEK